MIRPGMTGWAQIRYGYANGLEEETEKMRYDLYYIQHMSLWLDLWILSETLRIVLGHGEAAAYRTEILWGRATPPDPYRTYEVQGPAPLTRQRVVTMPIASDVKLGERVVIHHPDLVNLYGCSIGDETRIGAFVEIQKNAGIGAHCKISSHTFICEGITIQDEVFIGHGVMFINDRYPRATINGRTQTDTDWRVIPTLVKKGASIGSGAVILCGVTIGERALIGAGAVVTHDVPDDAVVAGVPARLALPVCHPEDEP